jgi:hypothetical protein
VWTTYSYETFDMEAGRTIRSQTKMGNVDSVSAWVGGSDIVAQLRDSFRGGRKVQCRSDSSQQHPRWYHWQRVTVQGRTSWCVLPSRPHSSEATQVHFPRKAKHLQTKGRSAVFLPRIGTRTNKLDAVVVLVHWRKARSRF